MREIVHLQAGQCGNQIGSKVTIRFSRFSALKYYKSAFYDIMMESERLNDDGAPLETWPPRHAHSQTNVKDLEFVIYQFLEHSRLIFH